MVLPQVSLSAERLVEAVARAPRRPAGASPPWASAPGASPCRTPRRIRHRRGCLVRGGGRGPRHERRACRLPCCCRPSLTHRRWPGRHARPNTCRSAWPRPRATSPRGARRDPASRRRADDAAAETLARGRPSWPRPRSTPRCELGHAEGGRRGSSWALTRSAAGGAPRAAPGRGDTIRGPADLAGQTVGHPGARAPPSTRRSCRSSRRPTSRPRRVHIEEPGRARRRPGARRRARWRPA